MVTIREAGHRMNRKETPGAEQRDRKRTVNLAASVFVLCVAMTIVIGVTASAQAPVFEVVSVKAHADDGVPESIAVQPNGDVRFTAFPLRTLITMAYRAEGIQRFDQLIGAPAWIASDRFDVVGKAGAQAMTSSQIPLALRAVLRDRFALRLHADTRDVPAYGLIVARADRRLGPQLRASTAACPAPGEAAAEPDRWCGIRAAGGVIQGRSVTAAQLAGNLAGYPAVDRVVTDRTSLTGVYDLRVEYSPAFVDRDAGAATGPSLFTALTEQLGLTLQPETQRVPVLVIDRVEKPSPD